MIYTRYLKEPDKSLERKEHNQSHDLSLYSKRQAEGEYGLLGLSNGQEAAALQISVQGK